MKRVLPGAVQPAAQNPNRRSVVFSERTGHLDPAALVGLDAQRVPGDRPAPVDLLDLARQQKAVLDLVAAKRSLRLLNTVLPPHKSGARKHQAPTIWKSAPILSVRIEHTIRV